MKDDLILEQEFNHEMIDHVISICLLAVREMIESKVDGEVNLPLFIVRSEAEKKAIEVVKQAQLKGVLNELYDKSYKFLSDSKRDFFTKNPYVRDYGKSIWR